MKDEMYYCMYGLVWCHISLPEKLLRVKLTGIRIELSNGEKLVYYIVFCTAELRPNSKSLTGGIKSTPGIGLRSTLAYGCAWYKCWESTLGQGCSQIWHRVPYTMFLFEYSLCIFCWKQLCCWLTVSSPPPLPPFPTHSFLGRWVATHHIGHLYGVHLAGKPFIWSPSLN